MSLSLCFNIKAEVEMDSAWGTWTTKSSSENYDVNWAEYKRCRQNDVPISFTNP